MAYVKLLAEIGTEIGRSEADKEERMLISFCMEKLREWLSIDCEAFE